MPAFLARIARVARRLVATLAGIALALVAAEYATRAVFARAASSGNPAQQAAPATPPRQSINGLGYREREIEPKNPARYRIAIIGDSYTWGQGVDQDERFSNVLGDLLGPSYEVLNFGLPGHTLPEHLNELDQVRTFSPDFVLLQLYVNDFETRSMRRPQPYPLLPSDWDRRLQESSVVYRLLSDRWTEFQESVGLVDSYEGYMARHLRNPASPDARESFGMLRAFFERARAAGVPSGSVLFPAADAMGPFGTNYPFDYIHEHVKVVCLDAHVPCLDLLTMFSSLPDPSGTWVNPFDAHPNAQTNRQVAVEILHAFGPFWRRPLRTGSR